MPELVGLDLGGGPAFVEALRSLWDSGDAAFPIDDRYPPPLRERVIDAMAPASIIGRDGKRRRRGEGRPTADGDALVVATSGSTGNPKGVVLTHEAIAASARATSDRLGVDPDRDVWLACLPLAHVGGLSVVVRAMLTGTPVIVHSRFDAKAVSATEATLVSLVPTALARIDPSRFRAVLVGGAAVPDDLAPNVVTTYGMTETGSGVVYDGVPLDGVEIEIDDRGHIHLRAPMLFRAYRDGYDPRDRDGWFDTGDLGELHDDRLTVFGRASDLIITGGENVWPEPVERVVAGLRSVADVAVAGMPDAEWGQAVTAFVVPADATQPPSLDDLRSAVREQLPAHCAPRRIVLVASIPRTALGKSRRQALIDEATPAAQ